MHACGTGMVVVPMCRQQMVCLLAVSGMRGSTAALAKPSNVALLSIVLSYESGKTGFECKAQHLAPPSWACCRFGPVRIKEEILVCFLNFLGMFNGV